MNLVFWYATGEIAMVPRLEKVLSIIPLMMEVNSTVKDAMPAFNQFCLNHQEAMLRFTRRIFLDARTTKKLLRTG
jgi:hypothetical protein